MQLKLSRRELECLRQIATGKTAIQVGELLGISDRTVERLVHNALRKTGLKNAIALYSLALNEGLLSVPQNHELELSKNPEF